MIIKCSRGNKIQNHFTIKTLKSVVAHPESFRPLNLSIMVISCAEIRRMCYAYIHFSCDKEMCPSYKIILIDFIFFFDWIIFYIQILTWHIKASSTSSCWHSKPWSYCPFNYWVHHTLNASMYTRFTIFIKRKAWCKWMCISKELEVTCSWQKGWCFCIFAFRHISYSGIPEYHIYKSKRHEN